MAPLDKTPYTPGMREVLRLSKAEAGRLGHDYIGPEHYLLGIIRKGDGLAIQVLQNLEIDPDDLKNDIERALSVGAGQDVNLFTPNNEAKRVLEAAKRIAEEMKHGWIGTEHLLLALIHVENTIASRLLREANADFHRAQQEVLNVIDGSQAAVAGVGSSTKKPGPGKPGEKSKTPALDTFGRDLTALAREGKLTTDLSRTQLLHNLNEIFTDTGNATGGWLDKIYRLFEKK